MEEEQTKQRGFSVLAPLVAPVVLKQESLNGASMIVG